MMPDGLVWKAYFIKEVKYSLPEILASPAADFIAKKT
jgi:hypothetical protein